MHICAWDPSCYLNKSIKEGPPLHLLQADSYGNIVDPTNNDTATIPVPKPSKLKSITKTLDHLLPKKCIPIELPVGTSSKETPEVAFHNLDDTQKLLLHYRCRLVT